MEKKIIILFPGVNYSVDSPLLYYAEFLYKNAGYETVKILSYEVENIDGLAALGEYAEKARENVRKQLETLRLEEYDEVVFASKSIGTVIALWLEDKLSLSNVTHLLLTPIDLTLPYMEKDRNYRCIVTGLTDKYVDHGKLKAICERKALPLTEIEGVGHRLETREDIHRNIEILDKVVKLYYR